MRSTTTHGRSTRRWARWYLIAPVMAIVSVGMTMSAGVAHAGTGGTVEVAVVDVHGFPENGVCLQIIVPGAKNSADVVVAQTAGSGADGTTGHITQANVPAGSYIGRYVDCGAPVPFAQFYTGATFNKAKAQVFGVVDGGTTNLGVQQLFASGNTGSIDGTVLDGSRPGSGIPSVSVRAYTASGSALLADGCTDQNGHYVLFELPGNVGGIKLLFGKGSCSNDANFSPAWYGGTSYATATPVQITADGNTTANDTSLALVTKSTVTVSSVTFGGDSTNPVITVNGTGFGAKAPKPNPIDRPCGEPDVPGSGYDYGNHVVFWDLADNAGWQVGFPGDCIGVNFVSYSATQMVFTLNDWYREPGNIGQLLTVGDPFTVRIKGAPLTGVVASIG